MRALDEIAARAQLGDEDAEAELLGMLRHRLLAVARRRVQPDDLEDVVQDSLRVIHQKYRERQSQRAILPWSFHVLRNVIGNHYRSRPTLRPSRKEVGDIRAALSPLPADTDPLAQIELRELRDRLARALEELSAGGSRCGEIFAHLIELRAEGDGDTPPEALADSIRSRFPQMTRNAFYVALHRCRTKLREILRDLEAAGV